MYRLFLSFVLILQFSYGIKLAQKERDWISNNVVIIGVEEWEPIIYTNDQGDIDGISGDIIKLISKKTGLRYKIVSNKWDYLLDEFKKGDIDLLPDTYYTDERATFGLFTKKYFSVKEYLYTKVGNGSINSFSDLKGKKLAIIKNAGTIPRVQKEFPSIQIVQTKDIPQSVQYVLEGKADALFDTQIAVENILTKNIIVGIKGIAQRVFDPAPLYFFSNIKKPILHSILQKGLNDIGKVKLHAIIHRWIGKENTKRNYIFKLTKSEKDYLKHKNSIKVCIRKNFMPLEGMKGAKPTGIAGDYIKLIEKKIKIKMKYIVTDDISQSLQKIKSNECDMIPIIAKKHNRDKIVNFTSVYSDLPMVVTTKDKNLYIDKISQIKGKTVAVISNSPIEYRLKKKYPKIDIIEVKNIYEGLSLVKDGKVFLCISNLATANHEIQKNFSGIIRIAGRLDMRLKLRGAIRKEDVVLSNIIQKAINSIDQTTKRDIVSKWENLQIEKKMDYSELWKIILVVLVVILLLSYRQKSLAKYNNKLKKLNDNLKLQKELYNLVFDNSIYGILLIDLKTNRFIECNNKIVEMLKAKSKKELLEIHPSQLSPKFQPDGRESFEKANEMISMAIQKGVHIFEWKHIRVDGEEFWAEIVLTKVKVDGLDMLHVSWKDIDAEKKMQIQLVELNDSLEQKVKKALDEAREKDKQLLQQSRHAQMGEMISMIAHQWRQPLAAISATSTAIILKVKLKRLDDELAIELAQKISDFSQHLSSTINDFREFFKTNKEKNEINTTEMIKDVLKIVETSIVNKNIELTKDFQTDEKVNTYPNELKQVILNLIKNAEDILLEKEIENPHIEIKTYKKQDNVIIEISDNAGGVPENIIDKIFDPYFSTKTKKDGTGLGLYMSKTIIEEHCGGKLSVENSKNGAVFKIEI